MRQVSILVPCRNAVGTLAETLESALAQGGISKEIIVVDDQSTDGSAVVARSFAARGVRLLEGPRVNASAARNRALAASSGDYIQYLDADDILGPEKIRQQVEILQQHPRWVAFGRWGRFQKRTDEAVFADDDELQDWSAVEWLEYALRRNKMMHPAAWLVPREVALAAGPWDEALTLNDDGEYFARVVSQAAGLKCVPGAVSFYRTVTAPSLSKIRGRAAYASLLRSVERTAAVLLSLEDSPRTRRASADLLQRFSHFVFPDVPELRRRAQELVQDWGGSDLRPDLGPRGQLIARVLGLQAAMLCSAWFRRRRAKATLHVG